MTSDPEQSCPRYLTSLVAEVEVVGFHLSRSLEFLRGDLRLLQDCGHSLTVDFICVFAYEAMGFAGAEGLASARHEFLATALDGASWLLPSLSLHETSMRPPRPFLRLPGMPF